MVLCLKYVTWQLWHRKDTKSSSILLYRLDSALQEIKIWRDSNESDEKNQLKYPVVLEGHKVTIYATDARNKCWEGTVSLAKYQWN